jgi:hypothetical protein
VYQVTEWKNETPNGLPLRYKLTDLDGTIISEGALIELLNQVVPGTPVNATNLNKIEQGIKAASDTADSALSKANTAQGSANLANTAAGKAQTAADAAKASAAAAQTSANSAAASASAAQSTANSASTGATNALAAAASAQSTANTANTAANTANTNASNAAADAAAALAAALARVPIFGYAERTTEFSTPSATPVDVTGLSVTLNLPGPCTVVAMASGAIRGDALYAAARVQISIDGVLGAIEAHKSVNSATTDISWVPFGINGYKANVPAGNRVIKVTLKNASGGNGNAIMENGNLIVAAFRNP